MLMCASYWRGWWCYCGSNELGIESLWPLFMIILVLFMSHNWQWCEYFMWREASVPVITLSSSGYGVYFVVFYICAHKFLWLALCFGIISRLSVGRWFVYVLFYCSWLYDSLACFAPVGSDIECFAVVGLCNLINSWVRLGGSLACRWMFCNYVYLRHSKPVSLSRV